MRRNKIIAAIRWALAVLGCSVASVSGAQQPSMPDGKTVGEGIYRSDVMPGTALPVDSMVTISFADTTTAGEIYEPFVAAASEPSVPEKKRRRYNYYFGFHTGVDLGGAIPMPLSGMGPGAKMNATPHITPALGVSLTTYPWKRVSITLEATYKEIGISADAWVSGQRFRDRNDPSKMVSFRGSVDVDMSFSMVEIPIYVGYSFHDRRSRVIFGCYYSKVIRGRFSSTPIKGLLTNVNSPDEEPGIVTPDDPYTQNFDDDLDTWDVGILAGYEWRLIDRLHLGARVSMGFKDIFKPNNKYLSYKMLHMRGSVVLSYAILRRNN